MPSAAVPASALLSLAVLCSQAAGPGAGGSCLDPPRRASPLPKLLCLRGGGDGARLDGPRGECPGARPTKEEKRARKLAERAERKLMRKQRDKARRRAARELLAQSAANTTTEEKAEREALEHAQYLERMAARNGFAAQRQQAIDARGGVLQVCAAFGPCCGFARAVLLCPNPKPLDPRHSTLNPQPLVPQP
jgi:hypothetical protein